ncbi:NlpC/P60 family protein [Limosilactobacillus vaginalis]|nr:NlpC/P60 family protein [Limosilactobacillus vaginalis]
MNTKKHFKLYKSGKQWLCMAIAITSATLGMSFASNAQADTDVQPQANQTVMATSGSTSSTNVESSTVSADSQSSTVEVAENINDNNSTNNVTTNEVASSNENSYAIAATSAKVAAATVTTPENGWNSNHTAFYQNGQTANGYVQADDGNYYMFKNGVRQSGVQSWMGTYYYFDPSTYLRVDNDYREQVWQDGTHDWYMFGNDGRIISGLYNWQGSTYYFDPSSYLRVDNDYRSTEADGRGVLLGSNGIALTGVQKWMGSYYYFDPVTKLRVDNDYRQSQWGSWYMFGDDGRAVSGLYNWQGSLYYFDPVTYLKDTNTEVTVNGQKYKLDNNGIATAENDGVDRALSMKGTPYVWGGNKPGGFDCSGLVQWAFKLGSNYRTTYQQQTLGTHHYDVYNAPKGALLFFGSDSAPYHVAISLGNGSYVHAPEPGDVVKIGYTKYFTASYYVVL